MCSKRQTRHHPGPISCIRTSRSEIPGATSEVNDPSLCGSGKKAKKCCLANGDPQV
ncbi:SEC-C metal-binding domain-containing protein [Bradyrhizobium australiense]|uniref:Uncharacterized protein n=1 Tax=Bradyrhizobium australiense TaxID=2721161 RepID=A0A7Y4LXS6_9BRAD|nr:hypothetical protein [Bradyrhizobium australiense]